MKIPIDFNVNRYYPYLRFIYVEYLKDYLTARVVQDLDGFE